MVARIVEMLHGLPGADELRFAIEERARTRRDRTDLDPDESSRSIMAIRAPVFDPTGSVVLALGIGQFSPDASSGTVLGYAERLREGTGRITEVLNGAPPMIDAPVAESVFRRTS